MENIPLPGEELPNEQQMMAARNLGPSATAEMVEMPGAAPDLQAADPAEVERQEKLPRIQEMARRITTESVDPKTINPKEYGHELRAFAEQVAKHGVIRALS